MIEKSQVVIYSRPECHLCEEAKKAIRAAGCAEQYVMEEVNIESERELLEKYRHDIPVITIDGVEAFRHEVSAQEFKEKITNASGGKPPFPTSN